ncbi:trypsin-like peptidase domain-containing protein [Actinoplanes sp. NPDC024001]|uniref:trypsin-like peptidase domain-containing protein n=1 Tax=Actinoplanes sp. NPDC024001 TaxID=3154598 RepID=UPI0033EEDA36
MNGERLRGLVAARTQADRQGIDLESVPTGEAGPPVTEDVLGRVAAATDARLAKNAGVDPREFRAAREVLLRTAERVTRRLDDDPQAPLTPDDLVALETVVHADGTRPSLLIRDGEVRTDDPLAELWAGDIEGGGEPLRRAIAAIGRVEPAVTTGNGFFGTCWIVDQAAGLALTNLHVLHAICKRLPHAVARTDSGFRVFDGAFADFRAESDSIETHRFKVVEAIPSGVEGPEFARLDAAVLRLEPLPGGPTELPAAITVSPSPDGPLGRFDSCCVVGYPGPPKRPTGTIDEIDWDWVNRSLFGRLYGVKRLAPGIAHRPLGSLAGDTRAWVFGHDATTLNGNSGSPILAWDDAAFGLHFGGITLDTNCAHGISAIATELAALGVPISEA